MDDGRDFLDLAGVVFGAVVVVVEEVGGVDNKVVFDGHVLDVVEGEGAVEVVWVADEEDRERGVDFDGAEVGCDFFAEAGLKGCAFEVAGPVQDLLHVVVVAHALAPERRLLRFDVESAALGQGLVEWPFERHFEDDLEGVVRVDVVVLSRLVRNLLFLQCQ